MQAILGRRNSEGLSAYPQAGHERQKMSRQLRLALKLYYQAKDPQKGFGESPTSHVLIRLRPFPLHSHPNSPFSKSKDTLRNPILANPKRPSKSFGGSESTSAMATLRAPRLSLPSDTPARSHRT